MVPGKGGSIVTIKLLCGLDEAGRGPLAGPVVAAAVILPADFPVEILGDSKKLSLKKRLAARQVILERSCWGIGIVDHTTIDEINILQASLLAMEQGFFQMREKLDEFLCREFGGDLEFQLEAMADGTFVPKIPVECRAQPKADDTFPEVMAASILAKVARDRDCITLDEQYPQYGIAKHKGYGTKQHMDALRTYGPSPIHRKQFIRFLDKDANK